MDEVCIRCLSAGLARVTATPTRLSISARLTRVVATPTKLSISAGLTPTISTMAIIIPTIATMAIIGSSIVLIMRNILSRLSSTSCAGPHTSTSLGSTPVRNVIWTMWNIHHGDMRRCIRGQVCLLWNTGCQYSTCNIAIPSEVLH